MKKVIALSAVLTLGILGAACRTAVVQTMAVQTTQPKQTTQRQRRRITRRRQQRITRRQPAAQTMR